MEMRALEEAKRHGFRCSPVYVVCCVFVSSETKKYALRSLFPATHYSKCIIAEMTFCQSSASEFQNKCPDSNIENLGESKAD